MSGQEHLKYVDGVARGVNFPTFTCLLLKVLRNTSKTDYCLLKGLLIFFFENMKLFFKTVKSTSNKNGEILNVILKKMRHLIP